MTARIGLGCLAFALLGAAPAVGQEASDQQLASALERLKPVAVGVGLVLRVEVKSAGRVLKRGEERLETTGIVVDPSGLVLVSQRDVSAEQVNAMLAASGRKGMRVDLKFLSGAIIAEGHEDPLPAKLVAGVPRLGIALLELTAPADPPLTAIQLDGSVTPSVGQTVLQVTRMERVFGNAATFHSGRVTGRIEEPSAMWAVEGNFSAPGQIVFGLDGRVLGVLGMVGVQSSSREQLLPRQPIQRPVINPASALIEALEQVAKERAKKQAVPAPAGDGQKKEGGDAGAPPAPPGK